MAESSMIGIDLAKHSFQVHGAGAGGSVLFRKADERFDRHLARLADG